MPGDNSVKALVIPDVHLKPWVFDRAEEIMDAGTADKAVSLMDIPYGSASMVAPVYHSIKEHLFPHVFSVKIV
jgi:hypothetical protein